MLGRDGRISLDQSGRDAAHGLDGQRQRCDIQQQDLAGALVACQLSALDGSADRNALIGVQALVGLLAGQLTDLLLNSRDTGGSADKQDLVDLCRSQACVTKSVIDRSHGTLDQ